MLKRLHFKNYFYTSIALDLVMMLAIVLLKGFLPPVVPLLYGNPTGNSQLLPTLGLLVAPGISLTVTVINISLSLIIKEEFLRKILAVSSVLVTILVAITVIKVFFLVGYF